MAIMSWKHKGIRRFFESGDTSGIQVDHAAKLKRILTLLNTASRADEMRLPGFDFHLLHPKADKKCSVSVNGNWRVTFRFENGNAEIVNYEDYH